MGRPLFFKLMRLMLLRTLVMPMCSTPISTFIHRIINNEKQTKFVDEIVRVHFTFSSYFNVLTITFMHVVVRVYAEEIYLLVEIHSL